MTDTNTPNPKESAKPEESNWFNEMYKQPAYPVLLGVLIFLGIKTFNSGLEGSKISEQVTAWEAQAAAQSEPLAIQVATADPSSC